MVFQNALFDPRHIANAAADFTMKFNCANLSIEVAAPVRLAAKTWSRPPSGMSKLNVDAGCFNDGYLGCGMVVRDNLGNVIFAATKLEKRQASPTHTEALALRWCLQWILSSNQVGHFMVETNSEVVVKCLQGFSCLEEIENIILDCPDIMSNLSNCSVFFIRRCKNVAAHCLVGVAKQVGSRWDMSWSPRLQLFVWICFL
ncbi:histone H4 [Trifolium pratense]|uniref:Histone H4 n=1 Tax=Trifolium pratense TaxID=57577 RepID=A0A2K3LYG6_TRIPR|nr:histone H4 [Trifolium pratense]